MKKALLIIFSSLLLVVVWFGEDRSFYCINNTVYVTVWKTYNNVCYIIPGKYYGLTQPSGSFIKTTNTNNITIFFSGYCYNELIFKREGDLSGDRPLQINNSHENHHYTFIDYDSDVKKWDKFFYKADAKRFNDVKDNADFVEIDIKENVATNKNGKKL
jgi:hypothetical protein